jgi:hypothetical protein
MSLLKAGLCHANRKYCHKGRIIAIAAAAREFESPLPRDRKNTDR